MQLERVLRASCYKPSGRNCRLMLVYSLTGAEWEVDSKRMKCSDVSLKHAVLSPYTSLSQRFSDFSIGFSEFTPTPIIPKVDDIPVKLSNCLTGFAYLTNHLRRCSINSVMLLRGPSAAFATLFTSDISCPSYCAALLERGVGGQVWAQIGD